MKKILIILFVVTFVLLGWYTSKNLPKNTEETIPTETTAVGPRNTTYMIEGKSVTLVNGYNEESIDPNSATKIVTKYFGNELETDLNNDGRKDVVFLITQNNGGSGTFYYVVAALNTEAGWIGSQATLLGDRIAPQTTELSQNPNHKNVIVVNYADRLPGEPMTTQPSQGQSLYLKLDLESLQFGQVEANFEGESDPNIMTLEMKTWTWIKTTYTNDTELVPNNREAFTLTLKDDGTFSASTDCNSMGGKYEAVDKQITFGNIAMTKMFCENSQEQDFATILTETKSFTFTNNGELIFELKSDKGSAIFR